MFSAMTHANSDRPMSENQVGYSLPDPSFVTMGWLMIGKAPQTICALRTRTQDSGLLAIVMMAQVHSQNLAESFKILTMFLFTLRFVLG